MFEGRAWSIVLVAGVVGAFCFNCGQQLPDSPLLSPGTGGGQPLVAASQVELPVQRALVAVSPVAIKSAPSLAASSTGLVLGRPVSLYAYVQHGAQ